MFEHYDELIVIWRSSAATKPLEFGVTSDDFQGTEQKTQESSMNSFANEECLEDENKNGKINELTTLDQHDMTDLGLDIDQLGDLIEVTEAAKVAEKRKIVNQIPLLIDNKRKHLEKTLSAPQRDKLLLSFAKIWQKPQNNQLNFFPMH